MPRKKNYNAPLPKPPGLNLSDPKTLSGAKGVATRKNNAFRKMVEKKFPLYREELYADFAPLTPEKVVERRAAFQEGNREWWRNFRREEKELIRRMRRECRELCASEEEFARLREKALRSGHGRCKRNRWGVLRMQLLRRLDPLSELADMTLAWLEQEAEPVTHWDLWRSRGDGFSWREISEALNELLDRELIEARSLQSAITDDGREILAGAYILPKQKENK